MRLEHLCDLELAYTSKFSLVQPYGSEEGSAYGEVEGTIKGEKMRGTLRGVNHPHRRSDKAMLPNMDVVLRTEDSATVLFSLAGRTVWVETPQGRQGRQLLQTLFEADDERYGWLNNSFCVLEGKFNPETMRMEARIYICVSELA